jgi:class 3 adenylate cyclase
MLTGIDNGQRGISIPDLRILLLHYGITDADRVDELERMARAENDQVWHHEEDGAHVAATQVPQIGQPCYRRIFAVDIEQSTEQNNSAKMSLRQAMYYLLEQSMVESGIPASHRDRFVDRGDGILSLIHPVDDVPKTLLLSKVVPMLDALLAGYAERYPEQRLRLRAVVHAGEVHFDGHGWFGEALDVAFRLLDAPEVKKQFRASVRPLLVVVSDDIYTSVVRHGYAGIDVRSFDEVAHVKVAGQRHRGWVRKEQGVPLIV